MTTTLNKILLTIIGICLNSFYFSQTPGEWTWMAGSNSNNTAVYGIQGIPDSSNTPGGIYMGAKWTDNQGNLWYYGGMENSPFYSLHNMWKYDVSTSMWTWMHGPGVGGPLSGGPIYGVPNVYSPLVLPGRTGYAQFAEWVDSNGDFWLFCDELMTGSTWKYNTTLNQWAFVHGNIPLNYGVLGVPDPANNPRIENCPISWYGDDGSLWLFDGLDGRVSKFDIVSNMWTNMHGGIPPFNGIVGQYDSLNRPPQKFFAQCWKSNDGTFYLFGGADQGGQNPLNSMWQYDPQINQWRVVHPGTISNSPVFGGSCSFESSNCPSNAGGQRSSWKDDCNRFYGIDQFSGGYIYCFDPAINQYALVDGTPSAGGVYLAPNNGTFGLSSPNVFPGSAFAEYSTSWVDNNGHFWKLGAGTVGQINSLFRFVPDLSCIVSISANFTASPQQGCFPLEVDFLPQDTSSTITFQWNFGDPSTLSDTSSSPTPSYTYNSPGVYTVELIVNGSNFCGTGTDTSQIIVTVVAPPVLSLSSDTSICNGSSVSLAVSGATTYSWSPPTGLNTTVGPSVIASPTTTTQYYVTGTTAGCSTTDSVMVSVNPLPQLMINDSLMCLGDTISLNVSGAESYLWSPGTGLNTTIGSSVLAFPTSTTVYTISGIDSNSCVGTKNVTVTVESITVNVNSDTICKNDSNPMVTLTASGAINFTWSPSTGLSSTSGNSVVCTANTTINYTVIGESLIGCKDSAQALVTVVPFFEVLVISDSICAGESVLLSASGANTYQWSTTQGLNLGSGSELVLSPTQTTEYRIIGKVLSCEDTAFSSITVFPIPSASIFASPNPVSSTNPEVTFSTNSQGNIIKWLLGANLMSNLASFTHNFQNAVPGNYIVLLVLENQLGCIDTISITVIIEEDILFFIPNSFTPNSDEFNTVFLPIISSGIASIGYEFLVYNRWGEIVFESNNMVIGWDGTYKGKMSQDGSYVWKLAFNSKYTSKRYEYTGHLNLLK